MITSTRINSRFWTRGKKCEQRQQEESQEQDELKNVEDLARFLEAHFGKKAREETVNGPSFSDLAEAKRMAAEALKR